MSYENVRKLPVPGIKNAYFLYSSQKKRDFGVSHNLSLIYQLNEQEAVEWIPDCGPLTILRKCKETSENAMECPFFGFNKGRESWSQLAVDELKLVDLFVNNNLESVFSNMAKFGENDVVEVIDY